jgi:putative ABC transport system permease protein
MRIGRVLKPALRALFAHRLRVTLVLASVALGVAAVLLTGAVGQGARDEVLRGVEALGPNLLVVRPAAVKRLVARKEIGGLQTTLRLADAAAIAELDLVRDVVPGLDGNLRVKAGTGGALATKVMGTGPAFPAVRNFRVRRGRFFDADDDRASRRVAVLGSRVEETLFPAGDAVGRWIRVRGVPFEVIGTLEAKGILPDGSDEDNQILIPLRTALRRVYNTTWISSVFVSVQDPRRMDDAEAAIAALLRERHRKDDFAVQNQAKLLASQALLADSLALFTKGLSALALLVGGTGILALMLLAVRERTGEIGLRMAVGALPRDILLQFLAESSALAFGGWLAGLALGGLGAVALAVGTDWTIGLPIDALLDSLAMTGLTGLGFGALPARKASLLPPVQALGRE